MLREISLRHFRSHTNGRFVLGPGLNAITGSNGSGKTSILEAAYILARGSSFRGSDSEILNRSAEWYRIDGAYSPEGERSVQYEPERVTGKKRFTINGQKRLRLMPPQKLPVVLFDPDHLRLINGSPSRRRDFIDTIASTLLPGHTTVINKYERTLLQRNNLLKQPGIRDDELFVWDVLLSELGSKIVKARYELISDLNARLGDVYRSIAGNNEAIDVTYLNPSQAVEADQLLSQLHIARPRDVARGFTSVGPHRHDLEIYIGRRSTKSTASRGETRSIVLALKMIELYLVSERLTIAPLLLLDDVFSELDHDRQRALMKISSKVQTIMTTTELPTLLDLGDYYHIEL